MLTKIQLYGLNALVCCLLAFACDSATEVPANREKVGGDVVTNAGGELDTDVIEIVMSCLYPNEEEGEVTIALVNLSDTEEAVLETLSFDEFPDVFIIDFVTFGKDSATFGTDDLRLPVTVGKAGTARESLFVHIRVVPQNARQYVGHMMVNGIAKTRIVTSPMGLMADDVNLGSIKIGTTVREPIVIRNAGNSPCTIDGVGFIVPWDKEGTVSFVGELPKLLEPGELHTVVMEYTPLISHSFAGVLRILSSDCHLVCGRTQFRVTGAATE